MFFNQSKTESNLNDKIKTNASESGENVESETLSLDSVVWVTLL